MIDSTVINSRIAKLRGYLKILKELGKENELKNAILSVMNV